MIQIQDKNIVNSVYFPKNTNIEGDLTLRLHSELTQKDYTFEVVDESSSSSYYKFNIDFKSVENGEYTYYINNADSGLIRIGNVESSTPSISTYKDNVEIIQYGTTGVKQRYQQKQVNINQDGTYIITPDDGYDALSKVTAYVAVPQTGHTDEEMEESYESGYTNGYNSGYTDGENYGFVNGYNSGTTDGHNNGYTSGKTDGIAEQKAKLIGLNINSNGSYTRPDGWSAVTVNVPTGSTINNQIKNITLTNNGDYVITFDSGYTGLEKVLIRLNVECAKTVQNLIDEGYATVTTGNGGNYITISSNCPYQMSIVEDLTEVALNEKKLTGTTNNIITWADKLPSGWTSNNIKSIYENTDLSFTPRAELFWGLGGLDSFSVSFAGGNWQVPDSPWGSGKANGVFAPRYNRNQESVYIEKGFRNTPKNLTVTIKDNYSSVAQTMFTMMKTTTAFTLNCQIFSVQDAVGIFEQCDNLESLTINGSFRWDMWKLCHNAFKNCYKLVSIPFVDSWGRESEYNTIYPKYNGSQGSADVVGMFDNCYELVSIGPVVNMNAINLNGAVVDDVQQSALTGIMFNCPKLTNVRLKNLGNNSWNFTNETTYTYIPNMDKESIEYILNNVNVVNGYTLTFSKLHQNEISQTAIDNAINKGWLINFE